MDRNVLRKQVTILSDRENILSGKTTTKPTLAPRRVALEDVGNHKVIKPLQNGPLKKPIQLPTVDISKNPIVLKDKNKQKIEKTAAVCPPAQQPPSKIILKRQESLKVLPKIKAPEITAYSSKTLTRIFDIDENDTDPMSAAEYIKEIMVYLYELEEKFPINEKFLNDHKSSARMRSVLVNWMCEVHINFKLQGETFHMSVAILDRYLQVNNEVGRENLQLVGATAMFIASKYEELCSPDLNDFVFICDNTFTSVQFKEMERDILQKLSFSFGRPLSIHFLRRFNKASKATQLQHALGKYLLELGLLEYDISYTKPSVQAAAACYLASAILGTITDPVLVWNRTLVHYTNYSFNDIKATVAEFAGAIIKVERSNYQAIRKKYAAAAFSKVSNHPKLKLPFLQKLAATSNVLKTKK